MVRSTAARPVAVANGWHQRLALVHHAFCHQRTCSDSARSPPQHSSTQTYDRHQPVVVDTRNTLVTRLEIRSASFHGKANAPMTTSAHFVIVTSMRNVFTYRTSLVLSAVVQERTSPLARRTCQLAGRHRNAKKHQRTGGSTHKDGRDHDTHWNVE